MQFRNTVIILPLLLLIGVPAGIKLSFANKQHSASCATYSNCNMTCTDWYDYNTDVIVSLSGSGPGYDEFTSNFDKAISIMKQFDYVVDDDLWFPHITLQYLCCYSFDQYNQIADVIQNLQWEPFNITFNGGVICVAGTDVVSDWVSFVVGLDPETEQKILSFVEQIEAAMNAAGIPVHVPRAKEEPFHSTLGVVSGGYPTAEVLNMINQAIPKFNTVPMTIDSFFMVLPYHSFQSPQSYVQKLKRSTLR